jgi:hypothetical protein
VTLEPGWLERSLNRARKNIEARPARLQPKRYRTSGKQAVESAEKQRRQASR